MAFFSIRVTHDDLTPVLNRLRELAGPKRQSVLRAGGNTLLSITQGSFNSVGAAFRASPWAAKRDGTPSNLQKTTTLAHSWRLTVTPNGATVSTDREYAAIHQFGGIIRPKTAKALRFQSGGQWWTVKQVTMPARPMLPITPDGRLTDKAATLVARAMVRAIQMQAVPNRTA